jgi:hypothetical protein
MADIKFSCPSCSRQIKTDAGFAGRPGVCPYCGAPITVPGPSAEEEHPRVHREGRRLTTPITDAVDAAVDWMRFLRGRGRAFWRYQRVLAAVGAYAILVAGLIMVLQIVVLAGRTKAPNWAAVVLAALAYAAGALILHYFGVKFALAGAERLLTVREIALRREFLDCAGLVYLLGTVFAVAGIAVAFVTLDPRLAVLFFFAAVVLGHAAVFTFNAPDCLNAVREPEKGGEAETWLSISVCKARGLLALVPPLMAFFGVAAAGWALRGALKAPTIPVADAAPVGKLLLETGTFWTTVALLVAGLVPVLFYVLYLAGMFCVEFFRAVLACGGAKAQDQ